VNNLKQWPSESGPADHVEPASGAQPETSGTTELPAAVDLLCLACGERGGDWQRGQIVKLGQLLENFQKNQRVALSADGAGHYVWTHLCADGIDVPGVGKVLDAPEVSPVEMGSGREDAGGGIGERSPDPASGAESTEELRDRLLARLLTAARDLAMGQVDEQGACWECGAFEINGVFTHDETCKAALVLRVIADLVATLPQTARDYMGFSPAVQKAMARFYEQLEDNRCRKIARELLSALYTMVGKYGMPTDSVEAATEIRLALDHAEAAKIDEVLL